jgi:DNA modification methylase
MVVVAHDDKVALGGDVADAFGRSPCDACPRANADVVAAGGIKKCAAAYCGIASGDYILIFRKGGENRVPVTHERGFTRYFGEEVMPPEIRQFRHFDGDQKENKFSHFVWRRYASSAWMDIRASNKQKTGCGLTARAVVDDGEAREPDDVKHVHPLMLDIIHRCVELYTNPTETVFTPFMGVGSEVYSPVYLGRRGIGVELKTSYFNQAVKNIACAKDDYIKDGAGDLFAA